jgi:hypothetical protein
MGARKRNRAESVKGGKENQYFAVFAQLSYLSPQNATGRRYDQGCRSEQSTGHV